MSEQRQQRPPIVDPLADYQPKTELVRVRMETRRRLAEQGVPFLNWDELEREIAEQRFGGE
jgi:hypothetical protein